jgi:DNA-binding response OmpR family regulator
MAAVHMDVEPIRRRAAPVRAPYTVLIADTNREARDKIESALVNLGAQVVTHAETADELEHAFFKRGPYDLVVCRAVLGGQSGLQVLAKARTAGKRASFIIYSSLDTQWLRVFVSDAEATVLSSRVVSLEGLANLADGMLVARRR